MTRRILLLLMALGLLFVPTAAFAPGVAAAEPDVAASSIEQRGYYVEPGTDVSVDVVEDAVTDAFNAGSDFGLIVLDAEPSGGATLFADRVLDEIGGTGTVVVIAPETIGAAGAGDVFLQADVDAALDAALDSGGDNDAFVRNIVAALTRSGGGVGNGASDGGGGGAGLVIVLLIVGGLILLVIFAIRRSSKERTLSLEQRVAEAREEIQAQLDATANDVLDLADRVRVADDPRADEFYEAASTTYTEALDSFERAGTLDELAAMSDRLDEAAWQLDASEAVLDGREVPPKPKKEEPVRCFFDPTHSPPFEEATLQTSAGDKTVRVCKVDAARLRQGHVPDSRQISVDGRQVPAAQAPRSHGGLGLGGMDLLTLVLGGMSRGVPMGGSRRSGGGIFGSRSSRRTGTSRGSRSSSGGSRSSSSRPKSSRFRTGRRRRR